ncbi:MAG: double-strand break repair protein AddB, partial [Acidimicrobiales bacterium]
MGKAETLFTAGVPSVFTMPPGAPFLEHLASGLRASLGERLSTALVLLPTRRAIRDLTGEFVKSADGHATLLPIMRPLGDIDENEPPFEPGEIALNVPPAIGSTKRRFELARIVAHRMAREGQAPDAASALAMTEPLLSLMNDLAMEELGVDALEKLKENLETLPEHFQDAATFMKIVAKFWPTHLKELNLTEPMNRRVTLLDMAALLWQQHDPDYPVIVAGSTGTLPATARLIRTIAGLDQGMVVLPGLDKSIDDKSFKNIDDQHPQASLKNLILSMGLNRDQVKIWPGAKLTHNASMRSRILSEALIPADETTDWPDRIERLQKATSVGSPIEDGLDGLSLIEAKTEEEEANVIAVIMRETLELPGKTCALVTPDPSLARRVRAKLSRWNVEVDSSAGEPLEETWHGSFLSLTLELAQDPLNPIVLAGLFKHKLFGRDPDALQKWNRIEKAAFRGPRPKSMDALRNVLKERELTEACSDGIALIEEAHEQISPLQNALKAPDATINRLAHCHTELIEGLAGGPDFIWRDEGGEKAQGLMAELIEHGDLLPGGDGRVYGRLLSAMMRGRVVRPRFGTSENLQILGPLEARMLEADTIILGGLNEGVWPAHPAPHPILSRGMRKQIGLTAPERRFGLAAHDFSILAAKPRAILTRSARTADGPAVMSRWLWRLKTLARGALGTHVDTALASDKPYLEWARALDRAPDVPSPANRPEPRPPLEARWPEDRKGRRLSVTQVQKLIRDPYAIYGERVLGLSKLDPLDQELGGREFGNAIHTSFERYAKNGDDKSADWLYRVLCEELANAGYEDHQFTRLDVRLRQMADWFVEWRASRRVQGWIKTDVENKGTLRIPFDSGDFELSGIADRIEQAGTEFSILDY